MRESLAPDDTVRVEPEDIIDAIAADQFNCAIVCAIQRKFPKARRVKVNKKTIAFSIGDDRFVYPTPESAVETIIEPLDRGGVPTPGLVRLKAGIVKPVDHSTAEGYREELRRRKRELKRLNPVGEDNHEHTHYGRF